MEIGTLRICYHWCCLVFLLLSVTLVSTQQVGRVDIQPRYEYMNRTAQMEVWDRYFQTMRDSQDDINLLAAVGSPLPPDVRPVTGPFGRYGRPAVEFTPQSYIGRWAKDLLPIPFYKDFGIKVTIFLQSIYGGVLFNVLEYDHSKVVLGLNIIQVDNTQQAIEFIYKNSPNVNGMSQELSAVFTVPRFDRRWTVFSLTVHGQEVTLYFNGCEKIMTAAFKVSRTTLDLRENAPIFIGMPGWYIKKPALFGALYDLMIFKDFTETIPTCAKSRAPEFAFHEKRNSTLPPSHNNNNNNNNDGNVVSGPTATDQLFEEDEENYEVAEEEEEDDKDTDEGGEIENVETAHSTVQTNTSNNVLSSTTEATITTPSTTTKIRTTKRPTTPTTSTTSTTSTSTEKSTETVALPTSTTSTTAAPTTTATISTSAATSGTLQNENPTTVMATHTDIPSTTDSGMPTLTKGLYDLRESYEKRKRQKTTTQLPYTTYSSDPNFSSVLEQYTAKQPHTLPESISSSTTAQPSTIIKTPEGIDAVKNMIENEAKKISETINELATEQPQPATNVETTATAETTTTAETTASATTTQPIPSTTTTTTQPTSSSTTTPATTVDTTTTTPKSTTTATTTTTTTVESTTSTTATTTTPTTTTTTTTQPPPPPTTTAAPTTTTTPTTTLPTPTMTTNPTKITLHTSSNEILDKAKEELENEMDRIDLTVKKVASSSSSETTTATTTQPTTAMKTTTTQPPPTTTSPTSTTSPPITTLPTTSTPSEPSVIGEKVPTMEEISNYVINKIRSEKLVASEDDIRRMIQKILNEEINIKEQKGEKGNSVKGEKGSVGLPGMRGLAGEKGDRGSQGIEGERGVSGAIGSRGRDGQKGIKGDRGFKGLVGPVGPSGPSGVKGSPGSPGRQPREGKPGSRGKKGDMGYPGDQGPRGYNGRPGVDGKTGEKGESAGSQQAHVLFTPHDLVTMEDMFPIGSFALVSSTDDLYIRSLNGWMQVVTHKQKFGMLSSGSLSGPTVAHDDGRLLTREGYALSKHPLETNHLEERLMRNNLIVPPSNIVAKRPYLLLAALNEPHSGNMHGITRMDLKCLKQAINARYYGHTFRAFLADKLNGINSLVPKEYQHLPVANLKGEQIFPSVNSIYGIHNYSAFNPRIPIYSFDMKDVRTDNTWPIKKIWHGSLANGHAHHKDKHCNNWLTGSPVSKATAASIVAYKPALNEVATRCDQKLIVLCLQITSR